jgi:hypothetical protein
MLAATHRVSFLRVSMTSSYGNAPRKQFLRCGLFKSVAGNTVKVPNYISELA